MRQLGGVLLLAALLCGCRNVPDTTYVPVPADGSVAHGHYSGTLTESLGFADARVSPDGQTVLLLQSADGHARLSRLDAASGRTLQSRAVAVKWAGQLGYAADGMLVLAGGRSSVAVDPATLQVARTLPAGTLSPDGTRLLVRSYGSSPISIQRYDTVSGALLPTADPLLVKVDSANLAFSHDFEWVAYDNGQALKNLTTGQRLTVSGQAPSCQQRVDVQQMDTAAGGFVLAESDGTLHQLDAAGQQLSAVSVGTGAACPARYSNLGFQTIGRANSAYRLLYQPENQNLQLISWTPGSAPVSGVSAQAASVLPGSLAHSPEVLLHTYPSGAAERKTLTSVNRFSVPVSSPDFPVSGSFTAAFKNATSYTLGGTLLIGGQTLALNGEGSTLSTGTPGLVFTQQLCGTPPFAPPCPSHNWKATLSQQGGQQDGDADSEPNYPDGATARQVQRGSLSTTVLDEDGLSDRRSFDFVLNPD